MEYSQVFGEGDNALLIDNKGRRYLLRLARGAKFEYHDGIVPHTDILGRDPGFEITANRGGVLQVLKPRLADYILKMPRGAQVVYPKDIGPLLVWADIGPGMTVLEAGTGSGALTLGLLRGVGERGRVISVERRPEHQSTAIRSISRWHGALPSNLDLKIGEVEEMMGEICPERIVLDLPEPWHAAEIAVEKQAGGGIFCAYLPTVPQIQELVSVLEKGYVEIEVYETLHRTWNISGRSVRPDHRMIGHTGFVVVGQRSIGSRKPRESVVPEPDHET